MGTSREGAPHSMAYLGHDKEEAKEARRHAAEAAWHGVIFWDAPDYPAIMKHGLLKNPSFRDVFPGYKI